MSSKNPISFAFSVLFEIAAVVAIVSMLPRINLRPSVSASQSSMQTLPLQTTDLRIQSPQSWADSSRTIDPIGRQQPGPVIEAAPASPQYVEQQLDRASQRLLNTVGGAVNQASQDWLRPMQPTAPSANAVPQPQIVGTGYPPENSYSSQPLPKQTAQRPIHSPTGTQRSMEPRPWLRY
jgi:hypothetical protein